MDLRADVLGLDSWARTLRGMLRRAANLRPVLADVADDFLELEREQFRSEGARAAIWKPLAPSTVRERGSAHPILDRSGALARSLTVQGAAGAVRQLTSSSLLVGTDDPKASYHQTGTRRMPERRPVDIIPTDRDRWAAMIGRYLVP